MADQRSFATRVGDGATRNFTFSFDYFDRDDIQVFIDGTLVTNWVLGQGGNAVSLPTPPATGTKVTIKRVTPTIPKVTYKDGAVLTNEQLNLSQQQTLYLTEEALDRSERAIEQHEGDYFDAKGLTVRNSGAPSEPTDLITKSYHDDVWIPQMTTIRDQTQTIKETFQPEVTAAISQAQSDVQAVADVNEFIIEAIRDEVFDAKTEVLNVQNAVDTSLAQQVANANASEQAAAQSEQAAAQSAQAAADDAAETLRLQRLVSTDAGTASSKAQDADNSATQSQAYRNEAQTFRTQAQNSALEAEAAESGAVALFGTLEQLDARLTSAINADVTANQSKVDAVAARNAAINYRDTAQNHKDAAGNSASAASISAAEALAHKNEADRLNDIAEAARQRALQVETELRQAHAEALQAEIDAEAAKNTAQQVQQDINGKVGLAEAARLAAEASARDADLYRGQAQTTANNISLDQQVLATSVSQAENHKNAAAQSAAEAASAVASVDREGIASQTIIYSILFG